MVRIRTQNDKGVSSIVNQVLTAAQEIAYSNIDFQIHHGPAEAEEISYSFVEYLGGPWRLNQERFLTLASVSIYDSSGSLTDAVLVK